MVTWTEIAAKLNHILGVQTSAGGVELQSLPLRIDCWNWAQDVFVHHTPRQRSTTIRVEDGGRVVELPSDFYQLDRVYDSTDERFWWPVGYRAGDVRYDGDDVLQFWSWNNQLFLEREISTSSNQLTLYYWAYYPKVEYTVSDYGTDDESVSITDEHIYTPRWAELALLHLAISSIMVPGEAFASDINEFRLQIEAGNPEHNPRMQSCIFHFQRYIQLLSMYPKADLWRGQ